MALVRAVTPFNLQGMDCSQGYLDPRNPQSRNPNFFEHRSRRLWDVKGLGIQNTRSLKIRFLKKPELSPSKPAGKQEQEGRERKAAEEAVRHPHL